MVSLDDLRRGKRAAIFELARRHGAMLDTLPDDASWEDVQCSIYVWQRVERGWREADQEKAVDQDEVELPERWLDK